MRKLLAVVVVVVVAVWLIMWIGAAVMGRIYTTDAGRGWPLGLGTLNDVAKRYPPAPATPAAYRLTELAAKLGINIAPRGDAPPDISPRSNLKLREAISVFLRSQIQKTTPEIDAVAEPLADYLAAHSGDLAQIRSVLLGEEEVAWAVDFPSRRAPVPNLLGHMLLHRVLLVNALDRARRGEAGAWDDARAAAALSRGLWKRPELISSLIALAIDRSVNAVARKLPLPPPPWFAEFQRFDSRRAALAARQAETSMLAAYIAAETTIDEEPRGLRRVVDTVMSPYTRMCTADALEADREMAIEVATTEACAIEPRSLARRRRAKLAWWNYPGRQVTSPNVDSVWQRLARFRAEREATERALRLRAGLPPLETSSCSDGKWVYFANGFRFSKPVPGGSGSSVVPLEFSR